jgi:hypothetical protein
MKRISLRKLLPWLVVVVVIVFAVYRLKFSPMPVAAYTVATGEVRGEVMGTGTLEARIKTTISPRIQEQLAEVLVDQNDFVKAGQLLARLDDDPSRHQHFRGNFSTKIPMLLGHGFWTFTLAKLPRSGFLSMMHEARTGFSMLLGGLFLLLVGAGPWSVDAWLTKTNSKKGKSPT